MFCNVGIHESKRSQEIMPKQTMRNDTCSAGEAQQVHRVKLLLEDIGDFIPAQVAAGDGVGVLEAIGAQRNLHARNEVIHPQSAWEVL